MYQSTNYYNRKRLAQQRERRKQQILHNIYSFIIGTLAAYGYIDLLLHANGY